MHDSGERSQFSTGAVRDSATDKPRPDLISPFFEQRLGKWLAEGAKKYDDRNWEKGIPLGRCVASIRRHLMQFQQGATDEDHIIAVACNAMFIVHFQEMLKRGVLPAGLDDLPRYEPTGPILEES